MMHAVMDRALDAVVLFLIHHSHHLFLGWYQYNRTAENDAGGNFQNGIYTGTGEGYRGKVTVTVKVADGKITELVLDDYADDKSYMERAENRIFQEMISRQNTDVDAVSGATYSSNGLIEAVNKALGNDEGEGKKPEQEESEDKQSFIEAGRFQNLTDGIYTGSADAFRGDVEVQVTVEKQKVTDISILSYCDTEEYFFRAAPAVIEQMKAEQSLNVDAVSGATYSSNGIFMQLQMHWRFRRISMHQDLAGI